MSKAFLRTGGIGQGRKKGREAIEMERDGKHSRLSLLVEFSAIAIAGVAASLVSVFNLLALNYILAALFSLLTFVLFQLVGTRETIETLVGASKKLSMDIEAFRVLNKSNLVETGVVNAYKRSNELDLDSFYGVAKRNIRIMQTWFPQADPFPPGFINAIKLGVAVKLLLLEPSSPMAKQRLRDLGRDESSSLPQMGLETMMSLIRRHSLDYRNIEIRYYNNLPTISLYAVDDRMVVSFFWQRHGSTSGPLLEVLGETSPLGSYIIDTFERVWVSASPFDISAYLNG